MEDAGYEWDDEKAYSNARKHGVMFEEARLAFDDPKRLIMGDSAHSTGEPRYYCIGRVGEAVITVRFTQRGDKLRIIGAGRWRKGRKLYEKENSLYG